MALAPAGLTTFWIQRAAAEPAGGAGLPSRARRARSDRPAGLVR